MHTRERPTETKIWLLLGLLTLLFIAILLLGTNDAAGAEKASDLDPKLSGCITASVFVDPLDGPWVGSGTAIASDGKQTLIVTAEHVLPRGEKVEVVWYDGSRSSGKTIAKDEDLDAALVLVSGRAKGIAPLAQEIRSGNTFAVGFPGRSGPQTRVVVFEKAIEDDSVDGSRDRTSWRFDVKGGKFGRGSSGSGIFRNGELVAMTTHGDRNENSCVGRDELHTFIEKACRSGDCPLDIFGIFRSGAGRSGSRGRSQFEIDMNVEPDSKQLLPGELIRGVTGGGREQQPPAGPPVEREGYSRDPVDRRLRDLEDSFRTLRTDLLRDVGNLLADALKKDREERDNAITRLDRTQFVTTRSVPANSLEEQVEQLLEQEEHLRRDKAKLLSELKRQQERAAALTEQLQETSK